MKRIAGIVILAGAVLSVLLGCDDQQGPDAQSTGRNSTEAAEQALSDPRVREVASHFACPCGSCGHDHLVDCQCDMPRGGAEAILTIQSRLEAGDSIPEAVEHLAAQYPEARRKRLTD
jgi:hypothetical protein